jgi:phospholipase C
VVLIQENHTFETHFGRYCQAAPGSSPTCNDGPTCCEAGPDQDPGTGAPPTVINDDEHASYDPVHTSDCELAEIDGGKMDGFVSASCGNAKNFAYADPAIVAPYWELAKSSALADRYFQPIAGASSSNDMYFASAGFVFLDNEYEPKGAVGSQCSGGTLTSFSQPTIGDLLNARGVSWTFYAEGYDAMAQAESNGSCAKSPPDCPAAVSFYPCVYDPGDVPFQYYDSLRADAASMRDLSHFTDDLASGTLPSVSYLKLIGYKTEHPGGGTKLSTGVAASMSLLDSIAASTYASTTLVLLTYDEGGGYFDHVAPPTAGPVDAMPYGTRLPFLAVGPFARKNFVSHVVLEHSSIVKFIEWNWLEGKTGQLGQRDTVVANLGSVLDPTATGENVPD